MENHTLTTANPQAEALTVDINQYRWVISIISLVIGGLGFIGNGLCARMMATTPMMPYSSSIFLMCVALSDSIVILYEIIDDIALHIPGWDKEKILYDGNEWRCRFGVYAYELCKLISAWLVVAMAAELTLVTGKPDKASVVYTRNRSFYISMAIGLIAIAGCFPFLVIIGGTPGVSCTSTYQVFSEIYSKVVLHMFSNCLLPLVIIFACNIRSMYYLSSHVNESNDTYIPPIDRATKPESMYQMRHAILSVSFFYIICTLPLTAIDLGFFIQRLVPGMVLQYPEWDIAHIICQCLFLLNYSAKLYLVSLFDPQVTKAFAYISRCGLMKSNTNKRQEKYVVKKHKYSIRGVRETENKF